MGRLGNISGKEAAKAFGERAGKSWGKWEVT
jgi:hypothetical protein